ncbi:Proteophosphoglycan 5 [Meredithblackwellia eburnea MCA 4105]
MSDTKAFIQFDTTSYVLLGLIGLFLVISVFLRPPAPLAHPFLLGRQATVSKTRYLNESPVYMSSGSSGMAAPLRPEKTILSLNDILQQSLTRFEGGPRGNWVQGGEKLSTLVMELRAGLLSKLGSGEGRVAIFSEDPTDALLLTLALILTPFTPLVIAPGSNLPSNTSVVATFQSSTLFAAAQQLTKGQDSKWISLGGPGDHSDDAMDLLDSGKSLVADAPPVPEAKPSDLALTIVSEGIPLDLSHLNLTASLISWLTMYPAAPKLSRPSINDTILSFHHPSTPYGLGIALLAIYTSAAISLPSLPDEVSSAQVLDALKTPSAAPPTLVFAPSKRFATPLYRAFLEAMLGDSQFVITRARDSKLSLLREGVISQSTFWDKALFSHVRKDTGLVKIRQLVLEGQVEQNRLDFFRIACGVPVQTTLRHAFFLGPLSSSFMYDFQRLPPPGLKDEEITTSEISHVGAPVAGVEVKLRGLESDIAAGRISGEILVRSPMLPPPDSLPPSLLITDDLLPALPAYPGRPPADESAPRWLRTGLRAEMGTEGVLWLDA